MKHVLLTLPFVLLVFVARSNAQESVTGKVFWYGSVDNKVHLSVRGATLEQKTVDGRDNVPGNYSFTMALPSSSVTVSVNKKEGRSRNVKVIQQPSADNNFTAVIEIHDEGGGADSYLLEIFWN